MPSIYGSQNPGPGALPTFDADVQQVTRVREFPGIAGQEGAAVFGKLSQKLGSWEDRAATDEGVQQGKVAGLDPNYRPDQDESLRGIARRNAADMTYANTLVANARNDTSGAWEWYQQLPPGGRDPAMLARKLGDIQTDYNQNHVFDAVRGGFNDAFSKMADPYLRGAEADADARLRDQTKASFLVNQNSARAAGMRVASIPSSSDADLAAIAAQHDAAVNQAVYQGAYSESQGVEVKSGFRQDLLGQRAWTLFQNTPDDKKGEFAANFHDAFGSAALPLPRGNNPGNIEDGPFARSQPGYSGASGRFATFDSPENGAAALAANLGSYARRGVATLNALTAKWAPAGDGANDPTAYAKTLGKAIGVDPDAKINLADPAVAAKLVPAMAAVEQGHAVALRGAGATAGLAPDTVFKLEGQMNSALRAQGSQAEHAEKLAIADIGGDLKQMEAGLDAPDAEWAAKRGEYAASPDPVVAQEFASADRIRSMYAGFKGLPPAEVEARVSAMEAQAARTGVAADGARIIEAGRKYAKTLRDSFDKDPLSRAAQDGVIPAVAALDFSSAGALASSLRNRVAAADQVAQHYGLARAPLVTPDDRETVKQIAAAGGEPMVRTAATVARVLGPRASDFLSQVGGDAPQFAHMGRLAAMGGDASFLRDAGLAIAQDHQEGSKFERPPAEALNRMASTVYGSAFRAIPDFAAGAKALASSALAAQAMREGYDLKAIPGSATTQALQKAAGATFVGSTRYGGVDWKGSDQVLLPGAMRAGQLATVLKSIVDADLLRPGATPKALDGTVMRASQLQGLRFTSLGPGVYLLSKGDPAGDDPEWVTRGDGGRFMLDLNALEPRLRQRVPGAYK